eukprot:8390387-Prorocentrum_lima.AAC.1
MIEVAVAVMHDQRAMKVDGCCHCAPELIHKFQRAGVPLRSLLGITHYTDVSVFVRKSSSRN